MPASEVEVWNLALRSIGHNPIEDAAEETENARKCREFWPIVRDTMLEGFDWDFARRYGVLTQINDDAELDHGWTFAYEWPENEALKIRGIVDPIVSNVDPVPFEVALRQASNDRKILTDMSDAYAKWTARVTEVSRYPGSFIDAAQVNLQARIIASISKSRENRDRADNLLRIATNIAQVATAQQKSNRRPERTNPRSIAARA